MEWCAPSQGDRMATKKPSKTSPHHDTSKKDGVTIRAIDEVASEVYQAILKGNKPDLEMPVRSLSNVTYDEKHGYFEIGRGKKVRTLTVNTVKTFAQTLKMMSLSKDLIASNDFAT